MGLLSKAIRALAFWKRRDKPSLRQFHETGGVVAFRLLQKETVREELRLTPEQTATVGRLIGDARRRRRSTLVASRGLDPPKRQRELQKLVMEVARAVMQRIEEANVLADEQRSRLQQIAWQQRGCQAFADPALRSALGLTAGQEESIMDILQKSGRKARDLGSSAPGNAAGRLKARLARLRKATLRRTLDVLSDDQRRLWRKLRGKPFAAHADRRAAE